MSAGPASRRSPIGRNTAQPAPRKCAARRLNGSEKDTSNLHRHISKAMLAVSLLILEISARITDDKRYVL